MKSYSITKGYFSGKYILRVWGRTGETLHNSAHDSADQARAELNKYNAVRLAPTAEDADKAINELPIVTVREGFESRTGHATPNDAVLQRTPQVTEDPA